jgi:uncharacterized membrane protein YqjE
MTWAARSAGARAVLRCVWLEVEDIASLLGLVLFAVPFAVLLLLLWVMSGVVAVVEIYRTAYRARLMRDTEASAKEVQP